MNHLIMKYIIMDIDQLIKKHNLESNEILAYDQICLEVNSLLV